MRKLMKIKLRSDLCAGVGKHYAAMIDLDTALDEYGLPYIPSRRLKGCMREAAQLIGAAHIDEIFGVRGSSQSGSLMIGNAVINDYENTVRAIAESGADHSEITDLFCSVRQETAIDSAAGTAKDKSLRFIRVVNKNFPESDAPLCFYAPLSFDDGCLAEIENICKALRNIGYHRNRGLGAVECSLIDAENGFVPKPYEFEDDCDYRIKLLLYLDSDLMLPASDSSHSTDFISGTAVLGALAARYKGECFEELFLSGAVRFGNLYISDEQGSRFIPAPKFLAKIKAAVADEDKGIKNTIGIVSGSAEGGELPKVYKPLKKGYVNPKLGCKEPERKIVYHNAVNSGDSGLYMQYCICGGQYFSGVISGKGKYLRSIYPLLSGSLRIGRSKTAQYAACRIVKAEPETVVRHDAELKAGQTVAFVLQSDVVLTGEDGIFTGDADTLLNAVKNAVDSGKLDFDEPDTGKTDKTAVTTKIISGYNAKWNLKKPQLTAFAAGSAIVAVVKEDAEVPAELIIGEKCNEGFGVIEVIPNAGDYAVAERSGDLTEKKESKILELVDRRRKQDALLIKAVEKANRIFVLNSSQIGRLLLMCREANSFESFDRRIASIKTEKTRQFAEQHFKSDVIRGEIGEDEGWSSAQQYIRDCLTVCKYILRKGDADNE